MIPKSTAIALSAAGSSQTESDAENAITSQFDSQIILAACNGNSTTPGFVVHYTGTPLNNVVAAYQTAGYTVTVGTNFSNPQWNEVTISW